MPLSFQIKLLRVLETKQVTRLGAVAAQKVNFRLVCASNEDLHALVEQQRFRSDLFYRINVISVSIPPSVRESRISSHWRCIFYACFPKSTTISRPCPSGQRKG